MKEHIVLPALIEVKDEGWVFTILVAVVRDDKERWAGMTELTQGRNESFSRTVGRFQCAEVDLTTKIGSKRGTRGRNQGG